MALGPDEYLLIGTGERFRNADGGSRQEELARCRAGETVELRREPGNPHDPMAVAVHSARGIQVGYLNREHAQWVGEAMDAGRPVGATVHRVASKTRPGSPLSLTMKVTVGP